jgi:Outer membrane protein beta-barrel domain
MTRRLVFWLAAFFLASLTGQAQDKVELFGGYSYEHYNGSPSANLNGWELSGQYKFARWLGGVADVDAHYGSPSGVNTRAVHYLFGPQISFPARVSPFFHVLIGGAHIRGVGGTNTSFGTAVGAGIDSRIAPFLSWRVIQFDYLGTRLFHVTQNDLRISTGLVVRF